MRKTLLLVGIMSLGQVSPASPVNAKPPDPSAQRAERILDIQKQITDLEAIGRARVLQEQQQSGKPRLRPAVQASDNVEHFAPVIARFVRFSVQATSSGDEPCLNTVDLYGPDSSANLTTADGVRLTASSVWPGHLGDFKDGKYARGWCWVGKERGKGWLQVELPAPVAIARLVWSRDTQNRHHDRVATAYKIEVSTGGSAWTTVATAEGRAAPGQHHVISRSTLVKALDSCQQEKRQDLIAELRKLGAYWPSDVKSGPQVGEGINGKFIVRGLNTSLGGRNYCPV
jgi:hypothetical protein